MFYSSKRKCHVIKTPNEIQSFIGNSSKLFSGYLWLNRPYKKQKWKRVYTCLYSSPTLAFLVWTNKQETQFKGFVPMYDCDVVHYLANSICIKPNGNLRVQIIVKADNSKETDDWIVYMRRNCYRLRPMTHTNRSSLTDEEESCCDDSSISGFSSPFSVQVDNDLLKYWTHWTYLRNGIISRDEA